MKSQLRGSDKRKLISKNESCIYCKCNNPLFLTIDHKTPLIRGGSDDESNLQTCCWLCNQLKGGLIHKEFLQYMKSLKALRKLTKVRLQMPVSIPIIFNASYYPQEGVMKAINDEAKK